MLTNYEYILFVSTFTCMTDRSFQCSFCKDQYKSQVGRDQKNRERKGCFDIYPTPIMQYLPQHNMKNYTKINYFKCPAYFYNSACAEWINYLEDYQKGIMPFKGSILDQPSKFVEVMDLVNNLLEENKTIREKKTSKYKRK